LSMLEEAVELMRELWKGDYVTQRGKHYTVENLRIFDVPGGGVDVAVAAMQPNAAELAGRIGDALINVAPKQEILEACEAGGGKADHLDDTLTLGPDPDDYLAELKEYEDAGYTHAYIHQIGPDQEGFLDFARRELLSHFA